MEAFGAAASVIGVVSLALQLVKTVQDLNDFLTSLEGAPDEVQRLTENLAHLKSVLQDVGNVAEMQQLHNNIPVLGSTMITALEGCQKEIESLEAVLKKAQIGYGSRRRLVRKWNSLKIVVKMKDIQGFEDRIRDSMQRLTLSMIANLSTISISNHGAIKILLANSGSTTQFNSTPVPFASPTQNALSSKPKSRTVDQHFYRYGQRYRRLKFTSTTRELVSTVTPNRSQKGTIFSQKKTISLSVCFLQYFVRFQIEMGNRSWKHSFIIYQILPETDKIWDLCRKGNIQGLQELFTNGTHSPFITDGCGRTLIHNATMCNQTETVEFLLQIGVDANLVDSSGFLPLIYGIDLETCKILVKYGQNDPTIAWPITSAPDVISWLLIDQDEFLIESPQLTYNFHFFASSFSLNFGEEHLDVFLSYKKMHSERSRIASYLLQNGTNLSCFDIFGWTPLDILFGYSQCEFDSKVLGMMWLEVLASVGVDLKEYIAEEVRLHQSGFVARPSQMLQKRYLFWEDSHGRQNVSWEWAIWSESPIHMLLKEFKVLCLDYDRGWRYSDWERNWPFEAKSDPHWDPPYPNSPDLLEKRQRRWNRQAERRERRQTHYKIPREYRPRRRGHNRMPGSWIEDKDTSFNQPSKFLVHIPRWLILSILGQVVGRFLHVYLTNQFQ